MIRVRKMLPGETRTYNGAMTIHHRTSGGKVLTTEDAEDVVAVVVGDVVMEFVPPCRVHYSKPGKKKR